MAYPYVRGVVEGKTVSIRCQDAEEVVLRGDDFAFVGGSISNLSELTALAGTGVSQRPADVVCALYRKNGYQAFGLLKGDFVIVHWQGDQQALTLVRDKFGIHNLYYVLSANGTFAFSTSLTELVNTGLVGKDIEPGSLYDFFSLGVILPPKTIYKQVHSVEPGQLIHYQGGKLEKQHYFTLQIPKEKISDRKFLIERCQQLLTDAVRQAGENAAGIGVYLSGGIDSAVVLSLAKQEAQKKPVFAFTMGPWGESSSDLAYSRLSAGFSGVEQVEWHAATRDLNCLPRVVALLEQPNSDSAALAYYVLAEEARKYGVAVMLSGQNADTIMGAMPYVKYIYWSDRLQRYLPYGLSWLLGKLGLLFPEGAVRNRLSFLLMRAHCVDKLLYFKTGFFSRYKDRLFPFLARIDENHVFESLYQSVATMDETDIADRVIYLDERFTEQPRCLEVTQKSSPGVIARLPFFDEDLIDFAMRIPNRIRAEENWDKMVLRDAARNLVHPEIYRKYKKSLVFPTQHWFGDILYDRVLQYLAASDFLKEFVSVDELVSIFRQRLFDYGDIVYKVLVLAIWYRINFETGFEVSADTTLEEVLDFDLLGQG